MRRSLGTAVFSGMLGVTLFGIFLTPVFFYVIQGLSETAAVHGRRAPQVGSLLGAVLLGGLSCGADRRRRCPGPGRRSSALLRECWRLFALGLHRTIRANDRVTHAARMNTKSDL